MLKEKEFTVLAALRRCPGASQRQVAEQSGLSLGTVNSTVKELQQRGLLDAMAATEAGRVALEPYRVDNAIIMAAGLSSRFAPISYERPKGVLKVKGEVLIERQIRQLQAAGIDDITVVVGYKKEEFFYLEDLLGVKIVVNDEYAHRNNNSTIRRVEHLLGNTYICSSDDYFAENPFEPYAYDSYYAAVFEPGSTDEYCLRTKGANDRIVGVGIGGADAWVMMGHAYWSRAFSQAFCTLLERIYDEPSTAPQLWEDIYREHLGELPAMFMRKYGADAIKEFDSLEDLRDFDPAFIENVDSDILDNICGVLACERQDIGGIVPIKQGLTNLSCRFEVGGQPYVYRHPGAGTDAIINRESETFSQRVGADLGIDRTFIFEDAQTGWKVSRYMEGCVPFDYHNERHVQEAMRIARTLHRCGVESSWSFDIYEKAMGIVGLLGEQHRTSFRDFDALTEMAAQLNRLVKAQGVPVCLCHNDFYDPNLLVSPDRIDLIDWEYSGMSDYASDLGTFICCSDYSIDEAAKVFEAYFERPLEDDELFHCMAYVSIASFYWFVWALYQDMCGSPVGEYLYLWYKYAKRYGEHALALGEQPE